MRQPISEASDSDFLLPFEPHIPALLAHVRRHWSDMELLASYDEHLAYGEAVEQSAVPSCQMLAVDSLRWQGHPILYGRLDNIVKTTGVNAAPQGVERPMLMHADIDEAFVLGVPDDRRCAVVGEILVPKPVCQLDSDELLMDSNKRLSSYQLPRVIAVLEVGEIPLVANGKADRRRKRLLLQDAHRLQFPVRGVIDWTIQP